MKKIVLQIMVKRFDRYTIFVSNNINIYIYTSCVQGGFAPPHAPDCMWPRSLLWLYVTNLALTQPFRRKIEVLGRVDYWCIDFDLFIFLVILNNAKCEFKVFPCLKKRKKRKKKEKKRKEKKFGHSGNLNPGPPAL